MRHYLVVVRTCGIPESSAAPRDAIIDACYWHPGDRDWEHLYFGSLDALTRDFETDGWQLEQYQQLDGHYNYEAIFSTKRSEFFGPTGAELIAKYGLHDL